MLDKKAIALIAMAALAFLLLNVQVPRFADDYCRYAEHFDLAANLGKTWQDYLVWSGRVPTMFLNYTFFSLGTPGVLAFDILNALSFFLACMLAVRIATPPKQKMPLSGQLVAVVTFIALWWFTPNRFGEVVLWKTGAMQYWWGILLGAGLLWRVLGYMCWDQPMKQGVPGVMMFLAGSLLFGAWLENLSLGVGSIWAGWLAYECYRRRGGFDRILAAGFIAGLVGAGILLFAPGNAKHAAIYGYETSFFARLINAATRIVDYLDWRIVVVDLALLGILVWRRPQELRSRLLVSASFAAAGLVSVLAMSGAPQSSFIGRVGSTLEMLLVFSSMALFPSHLFEDLGSAVTRLMMVAAGLAMLAVMVNFMYVTTVYRRIHHQVEMRNEITSMAEDAGVDTVVYLPPIYFNADRSTMKGTINKARFFARDITEDPHDWRNRCYARAHGIPAAALKKFSAPTAQ